MSRVITFCQTVYNSIRKKKFNELNVLFELVSLSIPCDPLSYVHNFPSPWFGLRVLILCFDEGCRETWI